MARVCPSCGHENADDVDFCVSCGGYVRWEPTRAAPAVQPPPAPAPPPPAAEPPPAPAAPAAQPAPPAQPAPAQQAPPAPSAPAPPQVAPPPAQPPAQAVAPPPAAPAQAPPPPQPAPAQEQPVDAVEEPTKRRWGRKQKIPGITGGGVSKPRVRGPRVQAPRVNIGPQGVKVSAPKVSAPRVAPPVARAPKLKQPKVPKTPKDVMKLFKKLPGGGGKGQGDSGAVTEGPVAAQPAETWHWDAVGQKSGRGKGVLVFLLLLVIAGAAAAAGWWFFVRDDGEEAAAKAAPAATAKTFVSGLQPLLVRSSRDRARIATAVTGVAACSLAPGPAGQQVGQTIAGRRAVLRQVRRVRPPNAQLRRARRMLEQSLAFSAAAGKEYSLWIASFNGACPVRAGPEYAKALAANGKAQASKNAFVKAYNPVAKQVGSRTWKSTEF